MSWSEQTLGELMDEEGGLIQTGPFGSQLKQSEYQEFGIPVIMPTNIHDGQIDQTNIARISDIKSNQLSRHHVRAHTIVLPRRGEISKRAYIRPEQEGWLCGTGCLKIEPQGIKIHPRFLYYFMDTPNAIDWLLKNAVGSTMLNLSAKILNRFPVKYPEIEEQKHIASILSAYDDLIENNRRRIALLEESARLLYREWFVHLRFPGHETTKIKDGVPEGWSKKSVSDFAVIQRGRSYTSKELSEDEGVPFVTLKSVNRNGGYRADGIKRLKGDVKPQHCIKSGEIVIAVTDMTRDALIVARPAMIMLDADEVATFSMDLVKASPRGDYSKEWLYHYFLHSDFPQNVKERANGTNVLHLKPKYIEEWMSLIPSSNLRGRYTSLVKPILSQTMSLMRQNEYLAEARDHLLPRLMDGRVEL